MERFDLASNQWPIVLAQQGGPTYGNREAFENGKQVGNITFYGIVGVVVIWGVLKLFKRK